MKICREYSILMLLVAMQFFCISTPFAKNESSVNGQNVSSKKGTSDNQADSNVVRLVGENGVITQVPVTIQSKYPQCNTGDIGGTYTRNETTICCAHGEDSEGHTVCIGYETCSTYTMQCLGDDGYYPVTGDPFDCTRDSTCTDNSGDEDGGEMQPTQIN